MKRDEVTPVVRGVMVDVNNGEIVLTCPFCGVFAELGRTVEFHRVVTAVAAHSAGVH